MFVGWLVCLFLRLSGKLVLEMDSWLEVMTCEGRGKREVGGRSRDRGCGVRGKEDGELTRGEHGREKGGKRACV